jgi:hypothetical protein
MVLSTLEKNLHRHPRRDHRTVIVHFAISAPDQVARIKRLGAIVSGNSYYTTALADNYSKAGLGPKRADQMVRMGDVERAGISYSFHSDMPMAPAQPLFLMHCGVNRTTMSGRVAAPEQRVSRSGALKAVTIGAAYSLRLEKQVGSIEPGKLANFTILNDNPITVDVSKIKEIAVWGTVHEGRIFPVSGPRGAPRIGPVVPTTSASAVETAFAEEHSHCHFQGSCCACAVNQALARAIVLARHDTGQDDISTNSRSSQN